MPNWGSSGQGVRKHHQILLKVPIIFVFFGGVKVEAEERLCSSIGKVA